MTLVAVLGPAELIEVLRRRAPEDEFIWVRSPDSDACASEAEVLFASGGVAVDTVVAMLDRAPNVRWLMTGSAGVDRLRASGVLTRPGLVVTNNGALGVTVAEHALALMLAAARRLHDYVRLQARTEWSAEPLPSVELFGATVMIYGLGSAGRALARMTNAMGMTVIGIRRRGGEPPDGVDRVVPFSSVGSAVGDADFLVIMVPLTDETRGSVDAHVFRGMKPSSWLVNVARGPVVDDADLLAALVEGRISGAALDVFDEEPLPTDHPFWSLANVIVTPHVAATRGPSDESTIDEFLANLVRFNADASLERTVRPELGY